VSRFGAVLLAGLVLVMAICSCDDDHYRYRAEVDVDNVIVADTVAAGDSALVEYTVPGGCNWAPQLESGVSADTIYLHVTLEFYYEGMPCAHGSWVDSLYAVIDPGRAGDYLLWYRDTDSTGVSVPVVVIY
jgi:hypothetical protein